MKERTKRLQRFAELVGMPWDTEAQAEIEGALGGLMAELTIAEWQALPWYTRLWEWLRP